jgi:Leucine-rich repeat (LRR) protein
MLIEEQKQKYIDEIMNLLFVGNLELAEQLMQAVGLFEYFMERFAPYFAVIPNAKTFEDLYKITEIRINFCDNDILFFQNLERLVFANSSEIERIDKFVINADLKFKNLKFLGISTFLEIENIEKIKAHNLPNVKQIILRNSTPINFGYIPAEFCNFTNLTALRIQNFGIITIPDEISKLQNLKTLSLDFNNIKIIPESMKTMKNLERFDFSHNQITKIPEFLQKCDNSSILTDYKII